MNPPEVIITCNKLITALKSASNLISDSAFVVIGTGALGAAVDTEDSPMAQFALSQDIDLCLTSDTWNLDRNILNSIRISSLL